MVQAKDNHAEIIAANTKTIQGKGLKREIGVWGLFINVINNTIGSGIFLLPAIIAGVLGNASIIAYIACGFLFLLVMLCYAEISSQVTCSGGSYAYIEKAFGSYAGFISNTLFWFGTGIFVTAALVNGFADILSTAFPIFKTPLQDIAFCHTHRFFRIHKCAWRKTGNEAYKNDYAN